jgi:hypothetical protein
VSLALVLTLHPAAGAGEGSSHGLASLLRGLLCGCASCAGELEPVAQAEPSCCGHGDEEPARRSSGCDEGDGCTCSHPDEVPVPDPGPLCSASSGGAAGDVLTRIDTDRDVVERTPCALSGHAPLLSASALPPPGVAHPAARGAPRRASRPFGAPATSARLAYLSTLLL